jgi:hypothetical protein
VACRGDEDSTVASARFALTEEERAALVEISVLVGEPAAGKLAQPVLVLTVGGVQFRQPSQDGRLPGFVLADEDGQVPARDPPGVSSMRL